MTWQETTSSYKLNSFTNSRISNETNPGKVRGGSENLVLMTSVGGNVTVKAKGGLIPFCPWCGKVRDENGHYVKIAWLNRNNCTDGPCPACIDDMKKLI